VPYGAPRSPRDGVQPPLAPSYPWPYTDPSNAGFGGNPCFTFVIEETGSGEHRSSGQRLDTRVRELSDEPGFG